MRRAFLASLPPQHPTRTLRYDAECPYWRQEVRRFGEMPGLLNALRTALEDACACPAGDVAAFERATSDAVTPAVLVWAALDTFANSWQYEEQFLALDGVDILLRTLAVFCKEPAVSGPAVGAALSLALRSPLGRDALDTLGAVRGVRAAMVGQPQLDYGGAFKDLKPWLDNPAPGVGGDGGDAGESEQIIAQRVVLARGSNANIGSDVVLTPEKGSTSLEAFTFGGGGDGNDGGGTTENSSGAANGAVPSTTGMASAAGMEAATEEGVDLSGVGGVWFAFQQRQGALLIPTAVVKLRRLTFNPAMSLLSRASDHEHPALLWVTADYSTLCYSYGERQADGSVPMRGERKLALRELLEVRRGISTKSLLQFAPKGSDDRCLAMRFSSKTVNVAFQTAGEMSVWAAALGALGAHVASLVGANGVNALARTVFAESLAGLTGGEDEFPVAVAAAEFDLDKALRNGVCKCEVQCGGRFCRQQLKQVEQVAAERRATTSKVALLRHLVAEKKRAAALLADLQKFWSARDREGLMVARAAATWRAQTAASAAKAAEDEVDGELRATQIRVTTIRNKIKSANQALRFTGLLVQLANTGGGVNADNPAFPTNDDVLPDEMLPTDADRIIGQVNGDDYNVALAALREMAAKTQYKHAARARRCLP